MNTRANRFVRAALVWGVAWCGADGVWARQPEPQTPPADARPEPGAASKPVREQPRRRARDDIQAVRDRADAALRRIDEGADPAQVREQFERAGGLRSQGRAGRGGRPDGQDRDVSPGDDRRGPKPLGPDSPFELSPEERQQMLRFLDENVPRMGAKMRELDGTAPEMVTRLLTRMRPRVRDVMESGVGDPAGKDLRLAEFRASIEVMMARRAADEAKRSGNDDALKARRDELRGAVGAHFDAQLALQEHEADRLVQRVEKLRADIKERRAGKDRAVERELDGPGRRDGTGDHPGERPAESPR